MFRSIASVWLVGFRPFFIATCVTGALFPMFWVSLYSGGIEPTTPLFNPYLSPLHWHMHEMFFGFGWALLGGFLLTASKNWLGIRGVHGLTLVGLVALWLLDRIAMAQGGNWSETTVYALSLPFITAIVLLLEVDLLSNHAKDTYRDNFYFVLALPVFIIAKITLLSNQVDLALGTSMTLGLFRLCFLIMLERTLEAFMKGGFGITLKRVPLIDHAIKSIGFMLIFVYWMDTKLSTLLCLALGTLMLIRLAYWAPAKALRRIDIGVMYLGYLAIAASLFMLCIPTQYSHWGSSLATHTFTLGAIGLIAPAMVIRISKGHTGRKVTFTTTDKICLYLMMSALVFRIGLPFFLPHLYTMCLMLSAACWFATFTILGFQYIPVLLAPRVDQRVH